MSEIKPELVERLARYEAALRKIADLWLTSLKSTPDEVVDEMAELASKALGREPRP